MTDNYAKIAQANLRQLYQNLPADLAENLQAERQGDCFMFNAFGRTCLLGPTGIELSGGSYPSVLGILISLYALNANPAPCLDQPFKAFKEVPNSMPYVGAFSNHTEKILIPQVPRIRTETARIQAVLQGRPAPVGIGGDFALVVYPLPKIALCYIFYEADEDFPAAVTCLYSNNAHLFLPVDALADVGEYSSKWILEILADQP